MSKCRYIVTVVFDRITRAFNRSDATRAAVLPQKGMLAFFLNSDLIAFQMFVDWNFSQEYPINVRACQGSIFSGLSLKKTLHMWLLHAKITFYCCDMQF